MTSKLKQKALTLTRPAFQAWLESKHPRSYIGVVGDGDSCPIARYVKDITGYDDVEVSGVSIEINMRSNDYPDEYTCTDLSAWAQNFIERIDSLDTFSVTAQRALKILKQSRSDGFVPQYLDDDGK